MRPGRKNLKFFRGVLESAGLGEVAFFLKKAQQNISFAKVSLDNTDFSSFSKLPAIQEKIARIRNLIGEVDQDISSTEQSLLVGVAAKEDAEGETENV